MNYFILSVTGIAFLSPSTMPYTSAEHINLCWHLWSHRSQWPWYACVWAFMLFKVSIETSSPVILLDPFYSWSFSWVSSWVTDFFNTVFILIWVELSSVFLYLYWICFSNTRLCSSFHSVLYLWVFFSPFGYLRSVFSLNSFSLSWVQWIVCAFFKHLEFATEVYDLLHAVS